MGLQSLYSSISDPVGYIIDIGASTVIKPPNRLILNIRLSEIYFKYNIVHKIYTLGTVLHSVQQLQLRKTNNLSLLH